MNKYKLPIPIKLDTLDFTKKKQGFGLLLVGVIAGTYSSIFLASPLLVLVEEWQNKKKP